MKFVRRLIDLAPERPKMQKPLFALSLGFGLAIMAQAAHSQTTSCGDREKVVNSLTQKYGETRQGIGLGRNNGVMEIYASDTTGTWTILVTLPTGQACLIAAGDAFESLSETLKDVGEDT
jgi:hypothetical protein